MTNKIKLGKEELLTELKDTAKHMELLLSCIIKNGDVSYAKRLSVDLKIVFSNKRKRFLKSIREIASNQLVF